VRALVAALAVAILVPARAGAEQIRIVRDEYGVPHVHATTRQAVSYGAGYAIAQDRLWQMHVFRHIGKGRLSELLGPPVVDIDKEIRFFTYTEQERAARYQQVPQDLRADLEAFVAGVNAWIAEVNRDPSKKPFEFQQLGIGQVPPWTVDDSLGLQDVLILSFGSGGGSELRHAALLDSLRERLGPERGSAAFDDLIAPTDPDTPVSVPPRLRWRRTPTRANGRRVAAVRGLHADARLGLAGQGRAAPAGARPSAALGTAEQAALVPDPQRAVSALGDHDPGLARLRAMFRFGSNAQIVGPRRSETRNTLQTGGPQVGYLVPQWLVDVGLHGGGLDALGMTFAGSGPAVLIGRGNGYAWTTTTGSSDLTDTYVEQLNPANKREYLFNGSYEPMQCRTERYSFRGAPFESEEICRTRHGPVLSFDEANNRAYSIRYAWFNREFQTVQGFFGFNSVRGLRGFSTAANLLSSNHNMFYTDDKGHFGYFHPGNHPVRPRGVDMRLPQDGTGGSEWRGLLPLRRVPRAIDFGRQWLVNWNNQPVTNWRRERSHPARDNVDDLYPAYGRRRLNDPAGDGKVNDGRRWDFDDLNANLRYAAMRSHEHSWYRSAFPAESDLPDDLSRRALAVLGEWDGFLLDRDGDGKYDSAGVTILRKWLDVLRQEIFADELPGSDIQWARVSSELWHVISPDSRFRLRYDWLGGRSRTEVAATAFADAVRQLSSQFQNEDPSTWTTEAAVEHYQRLNADLGRDLAATELCDATDALLPDCPLDPGTGAGDSGSPGDIPEHIQMDRGTYNHIVQYLRRPARRRGLGLIPAKAGSVIPPGQSGFISPEGQEDPHFQDQLELYVQWRYKPMPLTLRELARHTASTTTLIYP
jgi:penicillin amidase